MQELPCRHTGLLHTPLSLSSCILIMVKFLKIVLKCSRNYLPMFSILWMKKEGGKGEEDEEEDEMDEEET